MQVELLTTPDCQDCARVRGMLEPYLEGTGIEYTEHDVTHRTDLVERYQTISTPVLIVNGEVVAEGVPDEEELRDRLQAF